MKIYESASMMKVNLWRKTGDLPLKKRVVIPYIAEPINSILKMSLVVHQIQNVYSSVRKRKTKSSTVIDNSAEKYK